MDAEVAVHRLRQTLELGERARLAHCQDERIPRRRRSVGSVWSSPFRSPETNPGIAFSETVLNDLRMESMAFAGRGEWTRPEAVVRPPLTCQYAGNACLSAVPDFRRRPAVMIQAHWRFASWASAILFTLIPAMRDAEQ